LSKQKSGTRSAYGQRRASELNLGDTRDDNKRDGNKAAGSGASGSLVSFLKLGYGAIVFLTIVVLGYVALQSDDNEAEGVYSADIMAPDYTYTRSAPDNGEVFDLEELAAVISGDDGSNLEIAMKDIDSVLSKRDVDVGEKSADNAEVQKRTTINQLNSLPDGSLDSFSDNLNEQTGAVSASVKPVVWRQNEHLWASNDVAKLPKLVVVIDDMGIVSSASREIAKIKGPFTLAYLPYANRLDWQIKAVRDAGHELIIHMPMEPKDPSVNPGDNALLADIDRSEFQRRLDWNMDRFEGFVGVNNHMGSLLTERAGAMIQVMERLKRDNLLFLDSVTSSKTTAASAARALGVPYASRDIFLDNNKDKALIKKQLLKAEAIAKRRGYAIAIGHPYDETLEVLKEWRKDLDARGFQLVPLSQIIAERQAKSQQVARGSQPNKLLN
jgi:polysaccharide deacetylase 2 family uncharacterized protein YibQ